METITLNGETYTQEVKLSSPKEILKYGKKGGEKAILTLKMIEHLTEETKIVKENNRGATPFCEFKMRGEDPSIVITGEAWGNNVQKIKEILPVNAVFKIQFKTRKPFSNTFVAQKVPYIIGFNVKKCHLYYPHEDPNTSTNMENDDSD